MFLTEANVLHYLCGRGFAGYDAVTGESYAVRNLSRRNRNFRVSAGRAEFLVKQARQWNSAGRSTIEREAVLCRRAHTDSDFGPLRRLIPVPHSYDPEHSILIFEFLPDCGALFDSPHRFAPAVGRLLAATMAEFHCEMTDAGIADWLPGKPPGALTMHQWDLDQLPECSAGQAELVRLVRRHAGFAEALDALESVWRPSALIHCDWKLENCLTSAEGTSLHVVDWELAQWGDPLWDAATLAQSWWNFWVRDPERYSMEEIRPVVRAFLDGYGAPAASVVAFAGARMLQSAWESLQKKESMEGEAVRLAQASMHILTRPEWARVQLLGHD
jgi:Ser/Thr protein kinase RdoA (MazF antagonist)